MINDYLLIRFNKPTINFTNTVYKLGEFLGEFYSYTSDSNLFEILFVEISTRII